ncbi:hypothetical protein DL95DRAFT_517677 [Leptodontidium sp. 2 PMI_412]|nr:hypothetical protein BKA61DRAFT_667080 [Leptodontidium sp. MPI-SDFR-AT-0119]KAH9223548.1 hypothetical protein DL95DRAFT_517677 [Leptodontidium sp. 2 PMI_412]
MNKRDSSKRDSTNASIILSTLFTSNKKHKSKDFQTPTSHKKPHVEGELPSPSPSGTDEPLPGATTTTTANEERRAEDLLPTSPATTDDHLTLIQEVETKAKKHQAAQTPKKKGPNEPEDVLKTRPPQLNEQFVVCGRRTYKNSRRIRRSKTKILGCYDNMHDANTMVAKLWEERHGSSYQVYFKDKEEDGRIWWAVLHQDRGILVKADVENRGTQLAPSSEWADRSGSGEETAEVKRWGEEIDRSLNYIDKNGHIIDMAARVKELIL